MPPPPPPPPRLLARSPSLSLVRLPAPYSAIPAGGAQPLSSAADGPFPWPHAADPAAVPALIRRGERVSGPTVCTLCRAHSASVELITPAPLGLPGAPCPGRTLCID